MPTFDTFATCLNNVSTTLAENHVIGDGQLVVADASAMTPITPQWWSGDTPWIRVTLIRASDNHYCIYKCTGIVGNTLTIVTFTSPPDITPYGDIAGNIGDGIDMRMTAGHFLDIEANILYDTTIAGLNSGPVTAAVGGIPAGDTFTLVPVIKVLDQLLHPYQSPSFTGFSISGAATQEVGEVFSGSKTFSWSTSNSANIQANSISITDVTNSVTLASGLANTGSATISISVVKNFPATNTWSIQALNTSSPPGTLSTTMSISWYYRIYYGTSVDTSLNAAGITALTDSELVGSSGGTYSFPGGGYKYFAFPNGFGNVSSFKDISTNLTVAMADNTVSSFFDNSQLNGLYYGLITIVNTYGVSIMYQVYRTMNILGGSISVVVTSTGGGTTQATSYTFTGPTSGTENSASSNFTVTPNNVYTGTITITPSGGGLSTPIVLTFSNSSTAQTFTITPTTTGTVTLSLTNSGSLTNPSNWEYTSNSTAPSIIVAEASLVCGTHIAAISFGTMTLLNASTDFTYLGYINVSEFSESGIGFGRGFTHRYVGSQLRFLNHVGPSIVGVVEYNLNGVSYGGSTSQANQTNFWAGSSVWQAPMNYDPVDSNYETVFRGLYWEDLGGGTGRLWTTQGIDYAQESATYNLTQSICVCNLDSTGAGTVSNWNGIWGFNGVSQRCVMWKVAAVPSWMQSAYGLGAYMFGFGGYASLASQGGTVSLGPFAITGPDLTTSGYTPFSYTNWPGGAQSYTAVPVGSGYPYKIAADFRSGVLGLPSSSPTSCDRGRRFPIPTSPTTDTFTNGYDTWPELGADNYGRWLWGDTYGSSGVFIDGPSKYGFVAVSSLAAGTTAYEPGSALHSSNAAVGIDVYDPATFGNCVSGSINAWNVYPTSIKSITADLQSIGLCYAGYPTIGDGHQNAGDEGTPSGATYDPVTKTLWLWFPGGNGGMLVAYSVNSTASSIIVAKASLVCGTVVTASGSIEGSGGEATAYTISGPIAGIVNTESGTFTVTMNGTFGSFESPKYVYITPYGAGLGDPGPNISVEFTGDSTGTFTITPTSTTNNMVVLMPSNSGGLNDTNAPIYCTIGTAAATGYQLLGPNSGVADTQSQPLTLFINGTYTGTITATFSGGGMGSGNTISHTWSGSSSPWTFTFTPPSPGEVQVAFTCSPTLSGQNPTPYYYVATPTAVTPAFAYNIVGPSSGAVGSASANYSIIPNGALGTSGSPVTVTLTPQSGNNPSGLPTITKTFAGTSTTQTFALTPPVAGANVLIPTSNGSGINNPQNVTFSAYPGSGPVPLSASDFTFEGFYVLPPSTAGELTYGSPSIAIRYVGSQLQLLLTAYNGTTQNYDLYALTVPSGTMSGSHTTPIATFSSANVATSWTGSSTGPFQNSPAGGDGWNYGFWWEDSITNPSYSGSGRLWTSCGIGYPGGPGENFLTCSVSNCTLGGSGIGTNGTLAGYWGFQTPANLSTSKYGLGISNRCIMGGVVGVPSTIQSSFGLGKYLYGFGPVASLISEGGITSEGPFILSGPDVSAQSSGSYIYTPRTMAQALAANSAQDGADWNVPNTAFSVVADGRIGAEQFFGGYDWYQSPGTPATFDIGHRASYCKNFYGSGGINLASFPNGIQTDEFLENYFNVNTPCPSPVGDWISPAPDGINRYVYGDNYSAGASIVNTSKKQMLVTTLSTSVNWTGYVNSEGDPGPTGGEIHMFDLADLAASIAGNKNTWNVQPSVMIDITPDMAASGFSSGPIGSCFDPTTNLLYVFCPKGSPIGYQTGILVYSINA